MDKRAEGRQELVYKAEKQIHISYGERVVKSMPTNRDLFVIKEILDLPLALRNSPYGYDTR